MKCANTHPVDEEGLCELDHLQCDQQADGDQVVVQDDEGQQVVRKVGGDITCNRGKHIVCLALSFTVM